MTDYTNNKVIDFIEYREMKLGIDIDLYLNIDKSYFFKIYQEVSEEINATFNELVELDRKLTFLNRKNELSAKEQMLYNSYVAIGTFKYERYTFLEEKLLTLNDVIDLNKWKTSEDLSLNERIED